MLLPLTAVPDSGSSVGVSKTPSTTERFVKLIWLLGAEQIFPVATVQSFIFRHEMLSFDVYCEYVHTVCVIFSSGGTTIVERQCQQGVLNERATRAMGI